MVQQPHQHHNTALEVPKFIGGRHDERTKNPWDTILLNGSDFVVTPTLGSLIPNWLLVWPKSPFLNCRSWKGSTRKLDAFSGDVLGQLGVTPSTNYIWFEHGCNDRGSLTGCGVDYAHLHILVDPCFSLSDFETTVCKLVGAAKFAPQGQNPSFDRKQKDYHVFGGNGLAIDVKSATPLGSQFFRKVVAELTVQKQFWNYREHTFEHNIQRTLDEFVA